MLIFPQQYELLRKHPLLSHISDDADMKWFLQCMDGEFVSYRAGETLFRKGEEVRMFPLILSGETDPVPPLRTWQQVESESGLSHSIIGVIAPCDCAAKSDCFAVTVKIMRFLKPCNHHCSFHEQCMEKIRK